MTLTNENKASHSHNDNNKIIVEGLHGKLCTRKKTKEEKEKTFLVVSIS